MSTFVQQEINNRNRWVYFTKRRWIAHALYWAWVLFVGTIARSEQSITPSVIFVNFFLVNLHIAVFFYLYCLYLIPYFFKRDKNIQFWLLLMLFFFLLPVSDTFFNLTYLNNSMPVEERLPADFWSAYLNTTYLYLGNFMLFSMMLFFMEKNEENDLVMELELEKKEIELVKLDLLKTNISPDFMMRSLSQLKRSATVPEPYTPESIITFSELLRYRLYRGKQLQSPLIEEIEALETFINFINYDQLHNNLRADLQMSGDPAGKEVAALALINVLEPFCKIIPDKPATLNLSIQILTDTLLVTIIYDKTATALLVSDLQQYGTDYINLYGSAILFNFENCADATCRIEMTLPLLSNNIIQAG